MLLRPASTWSQGREELVPQRGEGLAFACGDLQLRQPLSAGAVVGWRHWYGTWINYIGLKRHKNLSTERKSSPFAAVAIKLNLAAWSTYMMW